MKGLVIVRNIILMLSLCIIFSGCNRNEKASTVEQAETATTKSYYATRISNDNPIDTVFIEKFNAAPNQVQIRVYEHLYYQTWKDEYDKVISKIEEECVDQVYKDELLVYKNNLESYLDSFDHGNYAIVRSVWLDNHKRSKDQWTSGGNGTRTGLEFEKGIIYRDAFFQLQMDPDYKYPDVEDIIKGN